MAVLFLLLLWAGMVARSGLAAEISAEPPSGTLLSSTGRVEFSSQFRPAWANATNAQRLVVRDRLRTLELSQAAVRMQDLSILRLNESTVLEILAPRETSARAAFSLREGAAYFLHRNQPRQIEVDTPAIRAGIDGTEFHLLVEASGRTVLTLIDGVVTMTNAQGGIILHSGEQGTASPGQAPVKTAVINARNVIQWCLYYPGVLDADELGLTEAEVTALAASLAAYRQGDLLQAFASYPPGRVSQARSVPEQMYHAGLRLSAGRVTNYVEFAASLNIANSLASALQRLLAAVNNDTNFVTSLPTNASQLLGQSYLLQSRFQLREALKAAQAATERSPNFGFAWERVAELEFSFGNLREAGRALERTLALSPRNAQAHALQGFVLSGRGRFPEAMKSFQTAIELDPRLANGWLGRGLVGIHEGDAESGLADIETASAMEPDRWLLRSYLAKAFQNAADTRGRKATRQRLLELAREELNLAARKDPLEPTPWLYSALLHEQQNRDVEAVRDLERSVELNDNRQLFRSRLLLDEDKAVRGANLARIYDRVGLRELSVQQASRAVDANYLDFEAHQFLADSYDNRRDTRRLSLRDEESWANQQFLANFLSPVGFSSLSRNVSQLEYSSLFQHPDFGLLTVTEYLSTGDFRETASHFGRFGKLGYALDVDYVNSDGDRPNNQFERLEWSTQLKYELTERDSVFLQIRYQDFTGGDLAQYYNRSNERKDLRFSEEQKPLLFAGYRHHWSEGAETLFLAGRLENDFHYTDKAVTGYILDRTNSTSPANFATPLTLYDASYHNEFEIYSAELNQILKIGPQTLQAGGRIQAGDFRTANALTNVNVYQPGIANSFTYPPAGAQESDYERYSLYAYDTFDIAERLWLTAGVAWDHMRYPENFRRVPVSVDETERDQVSPKAGIVWTPTSRLTLLGIYARSLSGASFEDSVRLEPTQIAGFIQSYRNLIPESLVGSTAGARQEIGGVGLDWKFKPGSYFGLEAARLHSDVKRVIGVYDFLLDTAEFVPSGTPQKLDYTEHSVLAVLNHQFTTELSAGLRCRFTRSELEARLPNLLPNPGFPNHTSDTAELYQPEAWLQYKLPCGFYTKFIARGLIQDNHTPALQDEAVPQFDLLFGWRFWRQQAEVTLGLLNLTDQDYKLNPLTPFTDIPRERAFLARLRLSF